MAGARPTHRQNALTLAVYGDAPYGTTPTDTAEFLATPAFIGSVNADPDVSRVVHVGDIHSGQQFCTEAYDWSVAGLWLKYQDPVVYTPGDNEWTDCHKPGEGGGLFNTTTGQIDYVTDPVAGRPVDYAKGDPAANLDLVRSVFFPTPGQALCRFSFPLPKRHVAGEGHAVRHSSTCPAGRTTTPMPGTRPPH